ncbi:MAG: anti-sigma factor [Yoonia sp.]|nr:anti-sigma factor [Yoonia sp.]
MLFGPPEKKKGLIARVGLLGPVIGGVIGVVVVLAVLDRIGFMQDPAQTDDLDTFVVQARFDPASNQLDLTRTASGPREGRALEMWLIAGDNAPVSLGVWSKGQANAVLDIPADLALQMAGGVLAVSDEPEGGSPTGAPTGDVLAVGQVQLAG